MILRQTEKLMITDSIPIDTNMFSSVQKDSCNEKTVRESLFRQSTDLFLEIGHSPKLFNNDWIDILENGQKISHVISTPHLGVNIYGQLISLTIDYLTKEDYVCVERNFTLGLDTQSDFMIRLIACRSKIPVERIFLLPPGKRSRDFQRRLRSVLGCGPYRMRPAIACTGLSTILVRNEEHFGSICDLTSYVDVPYIIHREPENIAIVTSYMDSTETMSKNLEELKPIVYLGELTKLSDREEVIQKISEYTKTLAKMSGSYERHFLWTFFDGSPVFLSVLD